MVETLIRKLEGFGPLPEDDKALVRGLKVKLREVEARSDLIREGDSPSHVHLIESGFACRYKIVESGRRQIVAFLVPGDFCDLHVFILNEMDHNIATLSPSLVVEIPRDSILALLERPALSRALLMTTLVDEAILREWVANLGQRAAENRIAHLFCEMHARMKIVGLTNGGQLRLPLTQSELGDTVGLSTVHVNRSLQALREQGLINFRSGMLELPDIARLQQLSGFRPNYLHVNESNIDITVS